jgi:hypothetical protein
MFLMVEEPAVVVGRRSRAEIARLVGLFRESGLGRRQFCERHGVALSTLNRHLKKWSQKQAGSGGSGEGRLVTVELANPSVGDSGGFEHQNLLAIPAKLIGDNRA